jgi:hypothetical protein
MAEGGEELFNLGAVTGWTSDFLVTEDQDLKVLVAFHAVIFKDRHTDLRYCYQYNIPEGLFPVPSFIFSSSSSMI